MYDAIVLAGGSARRLGGSDKPGLEIAGTPMLDLVLGAVPDAHRTVVVGPARSTRLAVTWTREDPPGGGPVAALAAALPFTSAQTVLLLAADLPWIAPAVPLLLAACNTQPAVLESAGRVNHLAAAWPRTALLAAVAAVGDPIGAPMRALLRGVEPVLVDDSDSWGDDCDTWDDVAAARDRGTRDRGTTST